MSTFDVRIRVDRRVAWAEYKKQADRLNIPKDRRLKWTNPHIDIINAVEKLSTKRDVFTPASRREQQDRFRKAIQEEQQEQQDRQERKEQQQPPRIPAPPGVPAPPPAPRVRPATFDPRKVRGSMNIRVDGRLFIATWHVPTHSDRLLIDQPIETIRGIRSADPMLLAGYNSYIRFSSAPNMAGLREALKRALRLARLDGRTDFERKHNIVKWRYPYTVVVSINLYSPSGDEVEGNIEEVPMRSSETLPLNHIKTYDYPILKPDRCVYSYFHTAHARKAVGRGACKYIIENTENIEPTYMELCDILAEVDIQGIAYGIDREPIYISPVKSKQFSFIHHNGHMYIPNTPKDIHTDKTSTVETPDIALKLHELSKKYDIAYHTSDNFSFSGEGISYTPTYDHIKDTDLEKLCNLRGGYSMTTTDFYKNCGIRPVSYFDKTNATLKYDINKAHRNVLLNTANVFPVSNGLEEYEDFDGEVKPHIFYLIDIPGSLPGSDPAPIMDKLYPRTGFETDAKREAWVYGLLLLEFMKDYKITPKLQFTTYQHTTPGHTLGLQKWNNRYFSTIRKTYDPKTRKTVETVIRVNDDDIRHYTGSLATWTASHTTSYNSNNQDERAYFVRKYGAHLSQFGADVVRTHYKDRTGVLAYLAVISLTTRDIYRMVKLVERNPPPHELGKNIVSLLTDSAGFINVAPPTTFKIQNSSSPGDVITFKPEVISTKGFTGFYTSPVNITTNTPDMKPVFEYDSGCFINGLAGMGKTHYVLNQILPNLDERDRQDHFGEAIPKRSTKYIISSTTYENAATWSRNLGLTITDKQLKQLKAGRSIPSLENDKRFCYPIQSLIKKSQGWDKIIARFKNIDYLFIDEGSQLTISILNVLERIKHEAGVKIVIIGDSNQCLGQDDVDYTNTPLFKRITDYHTHTIEFHDNCRYGRRYYDFLSKILEEGRAGNIEICRQLVFSLPNQGMKSGIQNLTWKHSTGKRVGSYATIHSTQGKTLKDEFNLYDVECIQDYRILYTALSRAKKPQQIYVAL